MMFHVSGSGFEENELSMCFRFLRKKIKTFVCISGETSLFICIELFWQMFVIDSGYWNFKSIIRFSYLFVFHLSFEAWMYRCL
jgi:hypothetical protein